MPLPYGAKPRLILLHLCSEVVRTKSTQIQIGESIRDFLQTMNIAVQGSEYRSVKEQMECLAACRMIFGMSTPSKDVTIETKPIETKPIEHFEAWLHYDGFQRSMWPGYLELSQRFVDTLLAHAVPLDPRAIRGLQTKIGARTRRLYVAGASSVPGAQGGRRQAVVGQSAHAIRVGVSVLEGLQKEIPGGVAEGAGGLSGCPD